MFDPYHKWLGIPKTQRPPTHYQLLGIAADECDPEVIEEAALRQTMYVRSYQIGSQAADCLRILNEISQAKQTLLDPARRRQYDAQLARRAAPKASLPPVRQARPAVPAPALSAPKQFPETALNQIYADPKVLPRTKPSYEGQEPRPSRRMPVLVIGGSLASLVVVGLVVTFLWNHGQPSLPNNTGQKIEVAQNQGKQDQKTDSPKQPPLPPKPKLRSPGSKPKSTPLVVKAKPVPLSPPGGAEGELKPNDPSDKKKVQSPARVHDVVLKKGMTYRIDLRSDQFDAYLRLEDPDGLEVASDDDSGGSLNSRILYSAPKDGIYKIVVTSFDGNAGGYTLEVSESDSVPTPPPGGEILTRKISGWVEDLAPEKSAEQRRSAALALGKIGSSSPESGLKAIVPLQACLDDTDAGLREAAVVAIGEIFGKHRVYDQKTLDRLCRMLRNDADPLVRSSAALALGNTGQQGENVLAGLTAAIGDGHAAVRQKVAWALGRMGDESIQSLRKLLADADVLVKRDAAASVQRLSPDAGSKAVLELLHCAGDSDIELRKAALAALVGVVTPTNAGPARTVLRAALKDPEAEIRLNAALALGRIGGDDALQALPELRKALMPENPVGVRQRAALAIGGLRDALTVLKGAAVVAKDDKDHIPELHGALADTDETVRFNAAVSCINLGPAADPYVPDLADLLTNRKEPSHVRAQAAVALSRIGYVPALQKAMPTLLKLFVDREEPPIVRERTLWPVRRYLEHAKERAPVYAALAGILDEKRTQELKMLQYDSAYLLGMFQQKDVPEKVLDVLLDFLQDTAIKTFAGVASHTKGVGEKIDAGTSVREKGHKDGRIMAVDALSQIGRSRVMQRAPIIAQLRVLAVSEQTETALRKRVQALLQEWRIK